MLAHFNDLEFDLSKFEIEHESKMMSFHEKVL